MRQIWILGFTISGLIFTGCDEKKPSRPKLDMKTDVIQVRGAVPLKLGEVILPIPVPTEGIEFRALRNRTNCQLPKAAKAAKVVNINAYEGPNDYYGPLFFASSTLGVDLKPIRVLEKRANITNVIVTETEQPVYLLLSAHDSMLWRIHTAPGVTLDGVSVVSNEPNALMVSGVPARRIGFVNRSNGDKAAQRKSYAKRYNKCWRSPKGYTNAKAIGTSNKGTGYVYTKQDLERFKAGEKAYKNWKFWIGQYVGHLDEDMSGYAVRAALVGPAPKPGQHLSPTPPTNPVYVAKDGYEPFWGTRATAYAHYPQSSEIWAKHR